MFKYYKIKLSKVKYVKVEENIKKYIIKIMFLN